MSAPQDKPNHIDIEYLKQQFEHLRAEMAGARERLSDNAHAALDRISAYLESSGMSPRVEELEETLKGKGKEAMTKLEEQVTHRPIASVAVAFGIGLLAARLLRR
ncbi:DUF883 family protein [Acidocella aromatica]|uniref:ElaB/YqjD/DUF883 family membrane-anchored ribosome-binding protein n=1 Tax=Acidocella aromatica TaxID=1303579 RepID=A0A840VN94_9PROT|nr:hypothetical protein [Acidocella aromatica]MBB5372920.1 ElaB/YqjD/DUF883 family membrane-anchored ribosome-binding protein [Acidocella aromatica]